MDENNPKGNEQSKKSTNLLLIGAVVIAAILIGLYLSSSSDPRQALVKQMRTQIEQLGRNLDELNVAGESCMEDYDALKQESKRLANSKIPDHELLSEARKSMGPILKKFETDLDRADAAADKTEKSLKEISVTLDQFKADPELYQKHKDDLEGLEEEITYYKKRLPQVRELLKKLRELHQDVKVMLDGPTASATEDANKVKIASVLQVFTAFEKKEKH